MFPTVTFAKRQEVQRIPFIVVHPEPEFPTPIRFQQLVMPPSSFGPLPKQTFLEAPLPERVERTAATPLKMAAAVSVPRTWAPRGISEPSIRSDLQKVLHRLPSTKRSAPSASCKALDEMDQQIDDLHLERPKCDIVKEGVQGKLVHTIEHTMGKTIGVAIEVGIKALEAEESKNSNNPIRDALISGAGHVSLTEVVGHTIAKRIPAYLIIVGVQGAAELAQEGENVLQDFLDKHSEEEFPPMITGECPDPCEATRVCKLGCQLVQYPAKALHEAHHLIVEMAEEGLDAIGLTEENIQKAANWMIENPPMPMP